MNQFAPNRIRKALLLLFSLSIVVVTLPAQAALHVKITESANQAIPVAVVPFGSPGSVPVDIAKVAAHDLRTTGLFDVLSRDRMLATPHTPDDVNYANWRTIGSDNLVVGTVKPGENGDYRIRFHILNVYSGESMASFEITSSESDMREAAHTVANLVYKQLTGEEGYFLSRIAYVAVTEDQGVRHYRLMVADYDGQNAATIYSSLDPVMSPAWSPDGKHIAYVAFDVNRGRTSLRVQEVATGKIREISSQVGINGAPAWSPDGSKLALTLSHQGNPDIYVYDLRSDKLTQLTHSNSIDTEASWSPDGRYIAFTSDRGGSPQIYRMSASGGQAERLTYTGNNSQDSAYSPDGKLLTFVENGSDGYRVAVMDLDSGNVRVVSKGPLDEGPVFAPNGQAIMYATQGPTNALATVSVDGQVHARLSQSGEVREPSWGVAPY